MKINIFDYTIGFTAGAFDLLHAGHVLMLKEVRDQCDHLIVGLHYDPSRENPEKNKPVQSLFERYTQLQAIQYVDDVIVYETEKELETILATHRIDVRFLDETYKDKLFTGKHLCKELEIDIKYNSRNHNYSSSELRSRIKN